MTTLTTITGREIKVNANHSAKTFTIRIDGSKYRTIPMSREEFSTCLNNTGNDWADFLKSDDYYVVKK